MSRVVIFVQGWSASDGTSVASHCGMTAIGDGLEIYSNGINGVNFGDQANIVSPAATDDNGRNPTTFADEQWSKVTMNLAAYSYSPGALVRMDDAGNGYGTASYDPIGASGLDLFRLSGGTPTFLASGGSTSLAGGEGISCEMEGDALRGYIESSLEVSTTDSTIASGVPGVYCYDGTNDPIGGTFECGNLYSKFPIRTVGSAREHLRARRARVVAQRMIRRHHGI